MSFITKRERVFNEYELFDLPARNENKLKTYASCTDARAWSHFSSDKTEHLVEIIKRNNETVCPKYLPTHVIVDTLMVAKNAEITRLKQKIEEFEQMLAAYDLLELSCDQKCEIADAHAAIKAANKELDDMCLDLDLSGFTETLESENYQTGKSRGDGEEVTPQMYDEQGQVTPMTEVKSSQYSMSCTCNAETMVSDPRLEELQDMIINKDAKLGAMKNTIAVMENDICEPYCIYAHIFTALEKIFGILCQNDKYRQYLNLLTAGKDTRCIDIKGKILFKLKVLEKFCGALIAPCNKDFSTATSGYDCECYRTEIKTRIETNYAITSSELSQPKVDTKRAQLVADIIQNEEIKEILSKESCSVNPNADFFEDVYVLNDYNIDMENIDRLKKLQENYDDLMTCYESLKHEKECFVIRCRKYEELEKEFENLKLKIKEYNSLWNEKEHYRKRSDDLDSLKEQYLILTDETGNYETQLKAESEINNIKSKTIDELRNENIRLEKKINQAVINFEKEKSALLCKLKEADCKCMCQGQQIKSLSLQIDRLLEQDQKPLNSRETECASIALIDEVESNRDQIKNLKDALFCNEEEKQNLQQQYQDQLTLITELRSTLADWKSAYEKTIQRNEYLEKYTESLLNETKALSIDVLEKSRAVDNLMKVVDNKSQEINNLRNDTERNKSENRKLSQQISQLQNELNISVASLENEKLQALKYLQLARQESEELLENVKNYDEVTISTPDRSKPLNMLRISNTVIQRTHTSDKGYTFDLAMHENDNSVLLDEIKKLRDLNKIVVSNVNSLEDANIQYKTCLELTQKESACLQVKLAEYENMTLQMKNLQDSYDKLLEDKTILHNELLNKEMELENAIVAIQVSKRESNELMDKFQASESVKEEFSELSQAYKKTVIEKHTAETELREAKDEIEHLLQSLHNMKVRNEHLLQQCTQLDLVEQTLQDTRKQLLEKNATFDELKEKKEREFNNLYNMLEKKIEENNELTAQLTALHENQTSAENNIQNLEDDNLRTQAMLNVMKKESGELHDKIRYYKTVEIEFNQLKRAHDQIKIEKEKLQGELDVQLADLKKIEKQNNELHYHSQTLISHSEELEKALINSRTELIKTSVSPDTSYKNIMQEIETMRREKATNQEKIRDLRDKLDESENVSLNYSEDLLARDDKIAILENHINALEDEVRKLNENLIAAVNNGEEMKEISFQKFDSMKNIEAHHSKAAHNFKMDIAKLQQQNTLLEEQLSLTTRKSDEFSRDNHRFVSEISHLYNEREIIVTEIKDLEITGLGDSALSPTHCDVEDILLSLDRIRKNLDAKNSKSALLEKTVLRVQTSSQLLLSKADEAKRLIEKEKQKIINEKEDAIKDRQNMEKHMLELKNNLAKQAADDKSVIQDFEATILNQKLIIDKINKSTQEYISKLKEDLQNVENLYHNSIDKISKLQEELQNVTENREKDKNMLDKIKSNFDAKSQEVTKLQKELEDIKNKCVTNIGTQTKHIQKLSSKDTQVERELLNKEKIQIGYTEINNATNINDDKSFHTQNTKTFQCDKVTQYDYVSVTNQNYLRNNEIQVLTANVAPTFDDVKNSYKQHKIKCLSTGIIEQCSISCSSDIYMIDNQLGDQSSKAIAEFANSFQIKTDNKGTIGEQNIKQSSTSVPPNTSINGIFNDSKIGYINDIPLKSPDKDLLVIYKDSHTSSTVGGQETGTWSDIRVEKRKGSGKGYKEKSKHTGKKIAELDFNIDIDKCTLDIKMPSVQKESNNSITTTSDIDKKSLDSYISTTNKPHKHISASDTTINNNESFGKISSSSSTPLLPALLSEKVFSHDELKREYKSNVNTTDDNIVKKESEMIATKNKISNIIRESHHELSRVGADVLLFKTENDNDLTESNIIEKKTDFSLEYMLATVQAEVNPNNNNPFRNILSQRSSNGMLNKSNNEKSGSLSKFSDIRMTSVECAKSPISNKTNNKTSNEKGVMAKLDNKEDYKRTINSLTIAIENIEKDYKKKIEAIKTQYDIHIKSIINDHNQGVKSIQSLHEETLYDMIRKHENEVENLRSMSIEAMRKAEKLEKENQALRNKIVDHGLPFLNEEPIKITTQEARKRKKNRSDPKLLTKTTVEALNIKPNPRTHGPCTCSLDVNIYDTIRNLFDQVNVEHRKMAENTYMKYIANKILSENVEGLDANELSFLHLKVCKIWKNKLTKEEALQKRIDCLETGLLFKQRNTQQYIADLDRKVAEERQRLQEVREAVCRVSTTASPNPAPEISSIQPTSTHIDAHKVFPPCACAPDVGARGSAGDLTLNIPSSRVRSRSTTTRNEKVTAGRPETEERRREHKERKLYNDEPPTRLRRSHDRQQRGKK